MFSPEIVRLMAGPRFLGAEAVIPMVAFTMSFAGSVSMHKLGMFLANKTKLIGLVSAVAAILNLALNYTLVSRFGMVGAAWATLFSFIVIAGGSYWASQRVFPLRLGVGRVLAGIFLSGCLYLVGQSSAPGWPSVTLTIKAVLLASFPDSLMEAAVPVRS